jgi:hypothetical protein
MASLSRLIKEPLLHFLLLGGCLFVLFYQVAEPEQATSSNQILVAKADVDRLTAQWQRQWKRPPTKNELEGLIDSFIREEVLYREALALGLDKDDVIVRRRLGQKLEFLFKDLAEQTEPGEEDLEHFLAQNAERYTEPGRSSFTHIYFNRDKRGVKTADDADLALARLNIEPGTVDPSELGDRFLYQYSFDNQSPAQISRVFGSRFSNQLAGVEIGKWQGPIESGYGIHLVQVSARTEARQPELSEIRDKVRWDVIAERRDTIDSAFYKELRQRYEVEFDQEAKQFKKADAAAG